MKDEESNKPAIDSPEFEEWLRKRCEKYKDDPIGNDDSDFDERDLASGNIKDLHKSDSELFPDELEEHAPEERRKNFKVHSNDEIINKDK